MQKGDTVVIGFSVDRASPLVTLTGIVWTHNGMELNTTFPQQQGRYNFSDDLQLLTISDLQVSDDGIFSLGAQNPAGLDNAATTLTVHGM